MSEFSNVKRLDRQGATHIWFLGTVYFMQKDRIFSARWPYSFNNYKNRAAGRISKIQILMKDCEFYFFERLLNLSKLKFKRSFTERLRNLYIWKILQSFCKRTICSLVLKDLAIFQGERMYTSFWERLRILSQKDCRFFNFERLCNLSERKIMQSFKIKESCNLSDIQYAIFLRKKSIL